MARKFIYCTVIYAQHLLHKSLILVINSRKRELTNFQVGLFAIANNVIERLLMHAKFYLFNVNLVRAAINLLNKVNKVYTSGMKRTITEIPHLSKFYERKDLLYFMKGQIR